METKDLLKKVVLPLAAVFLVVILVVLVVAAAKKRSPKAKPGTSSAQQEDKKIKDKALEQTRQSIKGAKDLIGRIMKILDPAGAEGKVRFLTVEANIIDLEKFNQVDLSKGQVDFPTVKKTYQIAVDKDTKFKEGRMEGLNPGDYIKATSVEGIYNTDKFTATNVDILSTMKK